jgi:hypothetical protein
VVSLAVVTIHVVVASLCVVEPEEILHNKPFYDAFKGFVLSH